MLLNDHKILVSDHKADNNENVPGPLVSRMENYTSIHHTISLGNNPHNICDLIAHKIFYDRSQGGKSCY